MYCYCDNCAAISLIRMKAFGLLAEPPKLKDCQTPRSREEQRNKYLEALERCPESEIEEIDDDETIPF